MKALLWLLSVLGLGIALAGCVTFADGANRTKGVLAVGLYTAVEIWQEVDLEAQKKILDAAATRAAFEDAITIYREATTRQRVVKAFRTMRHGLAVLSAALRAYESGSAKKPEVDKALAAAFDAAAELVAALQAAGVKISVATLLGGS